MASVVGGRFVEISFVVIKGLKSLDRKEKCESRRKNYYDLNKSFQY